MIQSGSRDSTPCLPTELADSSAFVLRRGSDPSPHDVGRTADVDERLEWHKVTLLLNSIDHFDPSAVAGRLSERTVTGHDRRLNRLCKRVTNVAS